MVVWPSLACLVLVIVAVGTGLPCPLPSSESNPLSCLNYSLNSESILYPNQQKVLESCLRLKSGPRLEAEVAELELELVKMVELELELAEAAELV